MKNRAIISTLLIIYIIILVTVLVFKNVPTIHLGVVMLKFGGVNEGAANLIPFKTILPYLLGDMGLLIGSLNILGNIFVLVPLGFLAPLLKPEMRAGKALILAIASGLLIETAQLLMRVGRFDIDDVILNGLGVMLGFGLFLLLQDKNGNVSSRKFLGLAGAATVCLAGIAFLFFKPSAISSETPTGRTESGVQAGDPCGGTGGLGPIIALGKNYITVRRGDNVKETVFIDAHTRIVSPKGRVTPADLKEGIRVTVVVMSEDKIANAIMICKAASSPE